MSGGIILKRSLKSKEKKVKKLKSVNCEERTRVKKAKSVNYEEKAYNYLKSLYGNNAEFREGQLEAILSVLNKKRVLVVQKTGWGKSLIYFL